jgi:hypothetical protein
MASRKKTDFVTSTLVHLGRGGREYTIEVRYYPPGRWRGRKPGPDWAARSCSDGGVMLSSLTVREQAIRLFVPAVN